MFIFLGRSFTDNRSFLSVFLSMATASIGNALSNLHEV